MNLPVLPHWNLRPSDIVDIAAIATLLYVTLVWFKRGRAGFIVLGILTLGGIYLLAAQFDLFLTATVLRGFFGILVIAILVIFQEELRHFFERVASWGMLRRRGPRQYAEVVGVLTKTVADLAKHRIGALIALQGRDPLSRHLDGGTPLQGRLSLPLLKSIFDPHSEGHDGAAVIIHDRVEAFGARLPLSKDLRKLADLGTRHAAALGLAERTDALCLIVSEERGTIALAYEGMLTTLNEFSELPPLLDHFFREKFPASYTRPALALLTQNPGEKVVACLLALGLWTLFAQRVETIKRDFAVPIEYRNLPDRLVLAEPKPREVTITLAGFERAFSLLDAASLKVSLDLERVQPGLQHLPLTKELVRTPAGLSVEAIAPTTVVLDIAEPQRRLVPVRPSLQGSPPSHRRIVDTRAEPPMVAVLTYRPLELDWALATEPIDVSQLAETTVVTSKLVLPADVKLADGKDLTIRVTVTLEPATPAGAARHP